MGVTGWDKEIKEIKEIKDDSRNSLNSLNPLNSLIAAYHNKKIEPDQLARL